MPMRPSTGAHLSEHVVKHLRVLDVRAEEDDVGIIDDTQAVSCWPVEEVVRRAGLLSAVDVGDNEFAGEHVAPMRGLAGITLQPLQQWSDAGARREREVFAAQRAE